MYLPTHFKHDQLDDLVELIQQYPLATVVMTAADGTLEVNHLPLEYEMQQSGFGVLRGHIAKANPMFEILNQSAHVYVIFQAEDAYISPNWYEGKQEHHRVVPTWNYRVVHVKGEILKLDDDKYLRGALARLTRMHEANQPMPWKMGDAPNEFIAEQLGKIVAIEIDIQSMIGKFKVSQNRSAVDVINVQKLWKGRMLKWRSQSKNFIP